MLKKTLVPLTIAITAAISPPTYAWNIVCGISLLSFGDKQINMTTKWEADSSALRGISEFYGAIAELQSINVDIALNHSKSIDKSSETTKISNAAAHFKASSEALSMAASKANQMITSANPADSIGKESMELWAQLDNYNQIFLKNIDAGELPNLYQLHEAIDLTQRIANLGMRASLMHLNQHKEHHTEGGAAAEFK